jgi:AcrR family transcriptional regulator
MMCPAAKVVSLIGRPRDHARDEAIHMAALELLTEVGYERTTIEGIAARAHVSKATIYRRFKNKQEILMAAMNEHAVCSLPQIDTGSLRSDLIELISEHVKALKGPDGELLMGLLSSAHRDPELGKLLPQNRPAIADTVSAAIFERAMTRKEISKNANIDFLGEVIPAIFSHRLFITHQSVNRKFIEHLVDDLLIPALNK